MCAEVENGDALSTNSFRGDLLQPPTWTDLDLDFSSIFAFRAPHLRELLPPYRERIGVVSCHEHFLTVTGMMIVVIIRATVLLFHVLCRYAAPASLTFTIAPQSTYKSRPQWCNIVADFG